jgi:hypothetical protein
MSSRPPDDLDALFALARGQRADTSAAEFAFETRLLARLRARAPASDPASIWAMVSWRMVPFFAAAVIAMTIWQSRLTAEATDDAAISSLTNPTGMVSAGSD